MDSNVTSDGTWTPPPLEEIAAIFPRLEVLSLSAMGGMSAVYRVRQPHLERDLALKLLRRGGPEAADWMVRFRKEALLMSRLHHRSIPTIFDFGHTAEGDWFCLMEFIHGVSLHLGHYTKDWTLDQAAQFIATAAEGLHVLHEEGVVHGDIKPDNIMVDEDGNVKIIDFGTSSTPGAHKLVTDFEGPRQVTAGFGAPEMYDASIRYDKSADVFGLGATFLQFVMGEAPPVNFNESLDVIRKQHRHIRRFLLRAMHADPARRHSSAQSFAGELRNLTLKPSTPATLGGKVTTKTSRALDFLKAKWTQLARN